MKDVFRAVVMGGGGGGGFWGARDPPFVNFVLSKQPTTGGENEMTIW